MPVASIMMTVRLNVIRTIPPARSTRGDQGLRREHPRPLSFWHSNPELSHRHHHPTHTGTLLPSAGFAGGEQSPSDSKPHSDRAPGQVRRSPNQTAAPQHLQPQELPWTNPALVFAAVLPALGSAVKKLREPGWVLT